MYGALNYVQDVWYTGSIFEPLYGSGLTVGTTQLFDAYDVELVQG